MKGHLMTTSNKAHKCKTCFYFCDRGDRYGYCDHPNNKDNTRIHELKSCNWHKETKQKPRKEPSNG